MRWRCWERVRALEGKWASGQRWKVRLYLDFYMSRRHIIWFGKSETTQLLHLCVWVTGRESEWHTTGCIQGMYRSEFYRVVRHKSCCLLFSSFPAQRSLFIHSFIHSFLWSSPAAIMSHWSRSKQADKKASPVCRLHSEVLTTDAPYPHFDRSLVHLPRAVVFCWVSPSGEGGRGGRECHAAVITLPPA